MPVDVSLTTRELGRMITQAGLLFEHLPDGAFDPMLGVSTGAAAIFGASGGVMEAALRTVVEQLTGEGMAPLEYQEVRGMEGVKEASYELPGKTVRVCVASGLHNVKRVLDGIRENTTRVWNTKAYLLAALFNAPATTDNHYTMLVNHDFHHDGG